MIDLTTYQGLGVAVLGLGRSGLATALALVQSGAVVRAWDDNEEVRENASAKGVPVVDLRAMNWSDCKALVMSPGIPLDFPEQNEVVKLARKAGAEIVGDVELLYRSQPEAAYVGITGTNGKSTTTTLVAHILSAAGLRVEVGGNLSVPPLELSPLGNTGIYVLEMSSYQLDLTHSVQYDVAILLNITPDHLERHGGMEGYISSKASIFKSCKKAVIGVDDEPGQRIAQGMPANDTARVSVRETVDRGVHVKDGILIDNMDGGNTHVCDLNGIEALPGAHNWQNAAVAYAACRALGVSAEQISAYLVTYPGLAHRQEFIKKIDNVVYINDSKATNADAAARALACYETIYWIAGGRAKEGGIASLLEFSGRIRHAFLIGEAGQAFERELENTVACTVVGDLKSAVVAATAKARDDGLRNATVLLSPACASFDQYKNFEIRGEAFREAVMALNSPGGSADEEREIA